MISPKESWYHFTGPPLVVPSGSTPTIVMCSGLVAVTSWPVRVATKSPRPVLSMWGWRLSTFSCSLALMTSRPWAAALKMRTSLFTRLSGLGAECTWVSIDM